MYIKQIVIDGFKSYAHRTEVGPFDSKFNAITGLNGSGKSNVLDSICFLLGISNLSQVRAGSLQELVYKGGQAGVTKATVTITFNNVDKRQSPLGYETFDEITVSRQVVIGGRNKYLINGSNAVPSRVQDLFRSVSLNVNNPHFLIMQGRITKVLNMKPPEILSMVEEAAGTKLYESKKSSAEKTIGKKDTKLNEIEKILEEEITPTLRKLREERSSYLEYQKVTRELEFNARLLVAYQFVQAENLKKHAEKELQECRNNVEQLKLKVLELEHRISCGKEELHELKKKMSQESNEPQMELEKEVDACAKSVALAEAALKNAKEQLKAETKNQQSLLKSLNEDEVLLRKKKDEVAEHHESYQRLQDQLKATADELTAAQQHFQAVSSGLSSGVDGQAETLAAQKMNKENEISRTQTQIKQANMRLKSMDTDAKEKEKEMRTNEKGYSKDKQSHDILEKEMAKLREDMEKIGYQEGLMENLQEKKDCLLNKISAMKMKISTLESKFPNLQFEYRDPTPNFNRDRVKGLVARLVRVRDVQMATALEVTAGGKLYNVVVDNEETGKLLLEKGNLRRRCTIIPIAKIKGSVISEDKIKRAKQLVGSDKVRPALSVVGYDDELKSAMEYVFGGAFVCDQLQDAKKVTFDDKVLTRSVSLAGDVFDPSGTLTGGSRPKIAAMLIQLQELHECEQEVLELEEQLNAVDNDICSLQGKCTKHSHLKDKYDATKHQADLILARLEQSPHHQQVVQLQKLKDDIKTQRELLEEARNTEEKAKKHLKDIQDKLSDSKGHHERELKAAKDRLSKARTEAESAEKNAQSLGQGVETLQLEVAELETSIANQKMQNKVNTTSIEELQSGVSLKTSEQRDTKVKLKQAEEKLNEYKEKQKEKNRELLKQENLCKTWESEKSGHLLQKKELEHVISKHAKESKEALAKIDFIVSKNDWISSEQQYFGQPNTAYDFTAHDPKEVQRKMSKLQEQKDKLSKNVNMRAMNMLGKAEEKFQDLTRKKKIVENDKAKIAELIKELDQKKNEALKTAWQKVNKDFGSIFSTLLPGAFSKLSAPEGISELEGLEIKVAFGGVWKESLTELSGGQRSLVALSLILSLLLFKPAPLYILDEVDAALDLSHTQNIGQMLRTHFTHSQFIVVSLKNGMFNNANVLFKTKFVDGVSTITRYVNVPSGAGNKENETIRRKGTRGGSSTAEQLMES